MKPIWEAIAGSFKKMAEAGKGVLFVVAGDLVCAAAPAADPTPGTTPVPLPVFCACGVQKHPGPFGGNGFHLGDVTKTSFFTWFWAPGGGPGRKKMHLKIVST